MKKILVDAYLEVNLGDDLFLKILSERYTEHLLEIRVNDYDTYKDIFSNYKNIIIKKRTIFDKLSYRYKIFSKISAKLHSIKYDAYVIIGGSIFIEGKEWQNKYNERNYRVKYFNKSSKPTFILGCNFGPYESGEFKHCYYNLFNECKDVCFRDSKSYHMFKELKNVRYESDIVFQLSCKKSTKISDTIGISVINLINRDIMEIVNANYISKLKEIIRYFIDREKQVVLLSFCEKEGDLDIIKVIMKDMKDVESKIKVYNYKNNIDKYLNDISQLENIIGIRFHSVILSQIFNQGIYPIIYSQKTVNTLNDLQLNNYMSSINEVDKLDTEEVFTNICNNKIQLTDLNEVILSSKRQFMYLDKFLIRNSK